MNNFVETYHKLQLDGSIYFNSNWIESTKIGGLSYFENTSFEKRTHIFLQKMDKYLTSIVKITF